VFEALGSLAAGLAAGSIALVGFGFDSLIEVTASVAAHWRFRADQHVTRRERVERISLRIIGWSFLALAAYIVLDSGHALWRRDSPDRTVWGLVILTMSVIVMPALARAKRRVAHGLGSRSLVAEATQTSLCAYLSVIAFVGIALNAFFGWWWADPVAALAMTPIIVREGIEGLRGSPRCCDIDMVPPGAS
jgi:divalent metal cation (Fe/Co/Zn/Cd) transporter